jgi:hypothetical protein
MNAGQNETGNRPADSRGHGDDILFGLLILLLALLASASPIRNYDYWWHLATGSWIVANGSIPHQELFSFTAGGAPWVDHEWLFQVLAYAGHQSIGPAGLVVLKILLVLGLCLLLIRQLQREGHGPSGAAVLLVPTLLGASFRFDVRPELATLILLPTIICLVMEARSRDVARPLYPIPLLVVLWANLHPGVVLLPAVLAVGVAAALAMQLFSGLRQHGGEKHAIARRFTIRLAVLTGSVALAVLVNPSGHRLYAVPFRLSAILASLPWPNLEWAHPEFSDFPVFWIVLPLAAVIALLGLRRADPVATPAMLLIGLLATPHLRNIGLFFVLLPLGLAGPLRAMIESLKRMRLHRAATVGGWVRPGFISAGVVVLSAFPLFLYLPPQPILGLGIAPTNDVSAAVDFLEREGVGARMYNDVRFGGYLIWRRFPDQRVFIDGRNELYADLMHDIAEGMDGSDAWSSLLERHGIDAAFLRYPPTLQRVQYPAIDGKEPREDFRAFSAAYFPRERWALVYWDDEAMIFLRRSPEHESVIARLEYQAVHPDDWQHQFAGVFWRQIPLQPILNDLERKLQDDPDCVRARGLYQRFAALERPAAGTADSGQGGGQQ